MIESNNIKSPKSGFKSWRIEKNSVKPSKNPVKTQISILDRSITAFARGTPKKNKSRTNEKRWRTTETDFILSNQIKIKEDDRKTFFFHRKRKAERMPLFTSSKSDAIKQKIEPKKKNEIKREKRRIKPERNPLKKKKEKRKENNKTKRKNQTTGKHSLQGRVCNYSLDTHTHTLTHTLTHTHRHRAMAGKKSAGGGAAVSQNEKIHTHTYTLTHTHTHTHR